MIKFVIENWNTLAAIAFVIGMLVWCAKTGVNTNIGEIPTNRR